MAFNPFALMSYETPPSVPPPELTVQVPPLMASVVSACIPSSPEIRLRSESAATMYSRVLSLSLVDLRASPATVTSISAFLTTHLSFPFIPWFAAVTIIELSSIFNESFPVIPLL